MIFQQETLDILRPLLIIKIEIDVDQIKAAVVDTSITDHYPILLTYTTSRKKNTNDWHKICSETPITMKINYKKLASLAENEDWSYILEEQNPDFCINLLMDRIHNITILASYKNYNSKKKRKNWITKGIIKSIKRRDYLYKKAKKSNDTKLWDSFKSYKKLLDATITNAKQMFLQKTFPNVNN